MTISLRRLIAVAFPKKQTSGEYRITWLDVAADRAALWCELVTLQYLLTRACTGMSVRVMARLVSV